MKKKKEEYFYNGIKLDSKEELYFFWYIAELLKHDYISKVEYQPQSFKLTNDLHVDFEKQLKRSVKVHPTKLLSGRVYTPDFKLYWTEKAHGILCQSIELPPLLNSIFFIANVCGESQQLYSLVDTKGVFDKNKSNTIFQINQSDVWEKHHVYVQKVVPHYKRQLSDKTGKPKGKPSLFESTFCPKRFLLTDGMTKKRTIPYEIKTIENLSPTGQQNLF